jgi:hypothetical protein
VLDVGSGVGKFCIVGALTTGASFSGIEHRPRLVEIANRASRKLGAVRTEFSIGTIEDVDWSLYDAFYLFNPFEENIFRDQSCLDRSAALSEERFWNDVAFIETVLALVAVGTRVATFHGFGGRIPPSYELIDQQPYRGGILRFWKKASADRRIEGGTLEALMPLPDAPLESTSVGKTGCERGDQIVQSVDSPEGRSLNRRHVPHPPRAAGLCRSSGISDPALRPLGAVALAARASRGSHGSLRGASSRRHRLVHRVGYRQSEHRASPCKMCFRRPQPEQVPMCDTKHRSGSRPPATRATSSVSFTPQTWQMRAGSLPSHTCWKPEVRTGTR